MNSYLPGRYSLNTYLSRPYLDTCIPIHQVGRPHPDSATRVYTEKPKKKSLGVLFRNLQYFRAHTATQLLPLPLPPHVSRCRPWLNGMRSLGRILAGKVWSGQVCTLITDAESPNGEYEVVGIFWGEGERIYAFEGLLALLACTVARTIKLT